MYTPFVEEDLKILSGEYQVTVCIGKGLPQVLNILRGILRAQIVYCWFASVYASIATVVARFFGKKAVMVVGGVDMAREREFGYGLWLSRWKSVLARAAFRKADRILVVDESLRQEAVERVQYSGDNIEVFPTGYDEKQWYPAGNKEPLVLTVAAADNGGRLKVKGIDILFEVARSLPHVTFDLVGFEPGVDPNFTPPGNVKTYPKLGQDQLLGFYQRAKVYCQPSRREGLSNTLCEAMLCGCIPVATDVGGTRRAVGGDGIVVPPGDPALLAAAIEKALALPDNVGARCRAWITAHYPLEKRVRRLKELIGGMVR